MYETRLRRITPRKDLEKRVCELRFSEVASPRSSSFDVNSSAGYMPWVQYINASLEGAITILMLPWMHSTACTQAHGCYWPVGRHVS